MSLLELFLTAVGLSMDAFAVSICKGLSMGKMSWKNAILIGLYFGGFQGLMPLIGYLLGGQFKTVISAFDHWIAFFLLALIGGNMIREAFSKDADTCDLDASIGVKTMLILAVATSIDALAVGVTYAFLEVSILPAICFIAVTTFTLSVIGVKVGNVFGCRYKSRSELAGGCILIIIGTKILISHLMGS